MRPIAHPTGDHASDRALRPPRPTDCAATMTGGQPNTTHPQLGTRVITSSVQERLPVAARALNQ